MTIDTESIGLITTQIFETMLGLTIRESQCSTLVTDICSSITITGESQLRIGLYGTSTLARIVAASMFCAEPDDLDDSEVSDAFGEVVNMIGGNLKGSFLQSEAKLSLPCIDRSCHGASVPSDDAAMTIFECNGEVFGVSMTEIGVSGASE